ncbi:MAG TPA: crosslink repair DNA glycosylase YcaQ family protein, partial [Chitinophagaceae bacterium]
MQAQEYAMSKWAIGLRIPSLKDADVERAFNEGAILRTHVLRPTWHFVTPEDIRWMLALTAPRVHAFSAYYYLTRRYFTSRGPATLQDFAWWSGLTIKEISEGIAL